jgi:hypothetical protein
MLDVLDPTRYVPVPEAAPRFGMSVGALRYLTYTRPGLAVRRFGRVYVDLEVLAKLAAPQPVATPTDPAAAEPGRPA